MSMLLEAKIGPGANRGKTKGFAASKKKSQSNAVAQVWAIKNFIYVN